MRNQIKPLQDEILELKGNLKDRNEQIDILQTLLDKKNEEEERRMVYSELSEQKEGEDPEKKTLKQRVKRMGTELDQKIERIQQLEKRGLDHVRDAQCKQIFLLMGA